MITHLHYLSRLEAAALKPLPMLARCDAVSIGTLKYQITYEPLGAARPVVDNGETGSAGKVSLAIKNDQLPQQLNCQLPHVYFFPILSVYVYVAVTVGTPTGRQLMVISFCNPLVGSALAYVGSAKKFLLKRAFRKNYREHFS